MSVNVTPITGLMTGKINIKVVTRYPYCSKGTGRRDNSTKCEERLQAVPFVFSTTVWAPGPSRMAGTPFVSAA